MAFRFFGFQAQLAGTGVPIVPQITVYSQGDDRYLAKTSIPASVCVQLALPTLQVLPADYDGFKVERSANAGVSWSAVSGWVKNSFLYIDAPTAGVYLYRALTKVNSGTESATGNEVSVQVGSWMDRDELGVQVIDAATGVVASRVNRSVAFPNGFDGDAHAGGSISEGSIGGSYADGSWFVESREQSPPIRTGESPADAATGVTYPFTTITYTVRDLPYPTGGIGIDNATLQIQLSTTSYMGGSTLTIYAVGGATPYNPTIAVSVVNGADPVLERDITITLDPSVASPLDVVTVTTTVADLHGNTLSDSFSFTLQDADITGPLVISQSPVCGSGIGTDTNCVVRDTSYSARITDDNSGVDLTSLQVYYGTTPTGPWTQILQNGSTWLASFTGSTVANALNGYDLTVHRPIASPTWLPDTAYYMRITVDDNDGNSTENICGFQTCPAVSVLQVVPLTENSIFVEFDGLMLNDANLRDPVNWTITGVSDSVANVVVREIYPQQFQGAVDSSQPGTRFGVGYPRGVRIETTTHLSWERYTLTINAKVLDQYGQALLSNTGSYRARRTKADESSENVGGLSVANPTSSLSAKILRAISGQDEQIGGVFQASDWEDL